jgi:hypothetical protein
LLNPVGESSKLFLKWFFIYFLTVGLGTIRRVTTGAGATTGVTGSGLVSESDSESDSSASPPTIIIPPNKSESVTATGPGDSVANTGTICTMGTLVRIIPSVLSVGSVG